MGLDIKFDWPKEMIVVRLLSVGRLRYLLRKGLTDRGGEGN